jgi:hypothetical protein
MSTYKLITICTAEKDNAELRISYAGNVNQGTALARTRECYSSIDIVSWVGGKYTEHKTITIKNINTWAEAKKEGVKIIKELNLKAEWTNFIK